MQLKAVDSSHQRVKVRRRSENGNWRWVSQRLWQGGTRRKGPSLIRTPNLERLQMPRCPRCAKRFKSNTRVLQHMNQPHSLCAAWVPELFRVAEILTTRTVETHHNGPSSHRVSDTFPADTQEDYIFDEDQAMDDSPEWHFPSSTPGPNNPLEEEYTGAAKVYGQGQTFMDRFGADIYAEHRETNLYYPFASKGDWEIGNFLEGSSLSMSAIDAFLSLELVSYPPLCIFFTWTSFIPRSNNYRSPFAPPKSCAAASSYCLPAQSGSCRSCRPITRQSRQFYYSIVTRSNVSSPLLATLTSASIWTMSRVASIKVLRDW